MTQFTPRYSIPYPTNSDPVYLGASQMEALARSVDNIMGQVSDASALDATAAATPNRIVQRDGSGRARFATPSAAADAATKGYTDGRVQTVADRLGGLTFRTSSSAPAAGTPSTTITFVTGA